MALDRGAVGVFDKEIDPRNFAAFLGDDRRLLALGVDQNSVVDMATGVEIFHPDKRPRLFVNDVGFTPTDHRCGIGRLPVEKLIAAARTRGCSCAWVVTESDTAGCERT